MMESRSEASIDGQESDGFPDSHFNATWRSAWYDANVTEQSNSTVSLQGHVNNVLLGVLLGSLSLLTVVMNILVLYAVKKERTLHTVGNLYIVSLSVADLAVGATVMPLNIVYLLKGQWRLGRIVCQFWLIMDYVASTASIFSLFILCLDRYRSVRQPLRYLKYRTRGRASVMISGAWLLSMTWIVPILGWRSFSQVGVKPETESKCDTDFRFVTWFKVLTAVFNFYIPSILMLWFYWKIYMAVRQHFRERERIINAYDSFPSNGIGQNVRSPEKSHDRSAKKVNMDASEYFRNDSLLDQYTLEQDYSKDGNEEESKEPGSDKNTTLNSHQTSFLQITRHLRKSTKDNKKRSPSQEKESGLETPLKLSSLPLGFLHAEDNNVPKMFVSVSDCHRAVPNSVAGVCEITQISDVQRYTTMLYNNDFNQSLASPWPEEAGAALDTDSGLTLKQTWQKFCDQSRQRIRSLQVHKEHKAAKQLGFIIAVFMMCWIPYFIAFMVMAFCNECVHHDLHMFTIWLGYINSTLNPFIYPLCNENFKRVFKTILHIHS